MKFLSFLKALKPKILKMDLINDIHGQRKVIEENILVNYREFNATFREYKFKSPLLIKIESDLQKRTGQNTKLFVTIESMLSKTLKNLDALEKLVDENFPETIYRDAINLVQLNLVQYISAVGFVTRYARNLMTLAMIEEAQAAGQSSSIKAWRVEHLRIEEQSRQFINTLVSVADKGSNIAALIGKVPNVFATEEAIVANRMNNSVVDPFALNMLDSNFNLLYFFGMIGAERDAANYHEAQEDFEAQKSLLLNLKLAQARQNDPKLEQKIQRQIERVQKVRRKLDEMEKKYGLKA